MKIIDLFEAQQLSSDWHPKVGWWLDNDPVIFYHGTHESRVKYVLEKGLLAPATGSTAGWVSLALEPNTALGYASMHGGETSFRSAGGKAKHVPVDERVVFVIKLPQSYFLSKMAPARGAMQEYKEKLTNKELYLQFKEKHPNWPDSVYYQLTEIRMPKNIPANFITGWMKK